MKKTTKALLMAACALALVLTTVMGTVAYLTSTATVENTFTVGKVKITLDEANLATTDDDTDRTTEGNSYKLMPGHTFDKDPRITVGADSEDCYLFVKIENGIESLLVAEGDESIAAQMEAKGWKAVEGVTDVYCYYGVGGNAPAAQVADAQVYVFDTFTVKDEVEDTDLKNVTEESNIVVTAYAVQADGFEDETAVNIWNATFGKDAANN